MGVFLVTTFVPAVVLWPVIAADMPRARKGPMKFVTIFALWLFSVATLSVSTLPNAIQSNDIWSLIGVPKAEPRLRCWTTNATFDDQNWGTVQLILLNEDTTTWLIRRERLRLAVELFYRGDSVSGSGKRFVHPEADILSWSDGDTPVTPCNRIVPSGSL